MLASAARLSPFVRDDSPPWLVIAWFVIVVVTVALPLLHLSLVRPRIALRKARRGAAAVAGSDPRFAPETIERAAAELFDAVQRALADGDQHRLERLADPVLLRSWPTAPERRRASVVRCATYVEKLTRDPQEDLAWAGVLVFATLRDPSPSARATHVDETWLLRFRDGRWTVFNVISATIFGGVGAALLRRSGLPATPQIADEQPDDGHEVDLADQHLQHRDRASTAGGG